MRSWERHRAGERSCGATRRLEDVLRRAKLCLLFMACLAYGVVAAEAADGDAEERAPLQLLVNDVDNGVAVVLVRDQDILMDLDDLAQAGLTNVGGIPETIGGKRYVSLGALAPRITYMLDRDNLVLRITADPTLFGANKINLQPQVAPPNLTYESTPGAFVNYAFGAQHTQNVTSYTGFTEQGISLGGAFFDNTLIAATGSRLSRGTTSLTIDDRENLTRLILGDSFAATGALGGTSPIAGVSYSTQFAVNPYFVPFPGQTFAGIVNTPSTADVYVNGQLVRTINLPPGPFNLQNLPVSAGAGVTRIVIRNAFGQTQELGAPFYLSTALLRQGLHQFTYNVGMERDLGQVGLGHYVRPAFLASHSYGLTDDVTPGAFIQADRHVVAGGPNLTLGLPYGQLGLLAAGSRDAAAGAGWSSSLEYSYQSLGFGDGIDLTYTSARYATISIPAGTDRAVARVSGFVSIPIGPVDATVQYSHSHFRDAGRSDQASLTGTYQLFDRVGLAATVGQSRVGGQPIDTSVFLSLNFALGELSTGTLSLSRTQGELQETAQLQKSLPLGQGFGYRAQVQGGKNSAQIGDVQYQGPFGLYEAEYDHRAGQDTARVSASGALVAVGGGVHATRAIADSFALVRVADVAGVDTALNGQRIGKTDRSGEILIPSMTSYIGSRVAIDDQTVPPDYTIDATERTVATPFRGAAIIEFPVRRQQALLGTLAVEADGKTVIPAYGDLTVAVGGIQFTSPVGVQGEFYLDGLPSGAHPALITFSDGECRFTLVNPATQERIVKLGQLTCRQ